MLTVSVTPENNSNPRKPLFSGAEVLLSRTKARMIMTISPTMARFMGGLFKLIRRWHVRAVRRCECSMEG